MHHHLIESFILALKLEEKYAVSDRYDEGRHSGYQINIKSRVLDGNFFNIIKSSKFNHYKIVFRVKNHFVEVVKRELQLRPTEYSLRLNYSEAKVTYVTIEGEPEFIYSKLDSLIRALEIIPEKYQQMLAC